MASKTITTVLAAPVFFNSTLIWFTYRMVLSIIIVSFNTKELLTQCLESIYLSLTSDKVYSHPPEIIVIDNASSDGSPDLVARSFPQVKLVRNSQNLGFGQANDLGAQVASGKYFLFLNSDTQLPEGSLPDILQVVQVHHPDIASFRLTYTDGSVQPQGGFLPHLPRLFFWMVNLDNLPLFRSLVKPYQIRYPSFFDQDHHLGWIGGTAMLVKSDVFHALNGFDPGIFMYAEDVDLCLRAHQKHFSVQYFAAPSIIHQGQGSGSTENSILGEFTGLKYIYRHHKPGWQYPLLCLILKLGSLLRIIVFGIIGKQNEKKLYQKAFKLA